MAAGQLERVCEELAHYGIKRDDNVRLIGPSLAWETTCKCGRSVYFQTKTGTPTEYVVTKVRRMGWMLRHGNRPICPTCLTKKETPMDNVTPIATQPNFKLERRVYAKLDEVFDESTRLYRAGWSDEKVAQELDVSPDFVVRLRRGAYGELAENPAVTKLRDDITLLQMELQDGIEKLRANYDKQIAELFKAVAHLGHHKAAG